MEKEVNGRFDTITTTTSRPYRIVKIVLKFLFFQMTKTNSEKCPKFNFLWVV